MALPAIHDGNASIRRQPLRHMGIKRVSEVKPPEHWIGALQLVAQASGGDHSHSSAFDRSDLCLISIEQSSALIDFGPPDTVTGMERQPSSEERRVGKECDSTMRSRSCPMQ